MKDIVIPDERLTPTLTPAGVTFELLPRNIGLAPQRTRSSANRTLMMAERLMKTSEHRRNRRERFAERTDRVRLPPPKRMS